MFKSEKEEWFFRYNEPYTHTKPYLHGFLHLSSSICIDP